MGYRNTDGFARLPGEIGEHCLDQIRHEVGEIIAERLCLGCALEQAFSVGYPIDLHCKAAGIDGIAIDIGIAGTEEEWIIISIHEPTVAVEARIKAIGTVTGIAVERSDEHTSELQSLLRTSYAVFCL